MIRLLELAEHWTESQQALVVTGSREVLDDLLVRLGLVDTSLVQVARSRYALALWGDRLPGYLVWRRSATKIVAEPAGLGAIDSSEHPGPEKATDNLA